MARKVLASALLIFMPFGGMRVICVDGPAEVTASTPHAGQAEPAGHGDDCDRLCPWPRPADSQGGADCALTADGASFVVTAGALVPPAEVVPQMEIVASEADAEAPQFYVEPGLTHLSPPPKA